MTILRLLDKMVVGSIREDRKYWRGFQKKIYFSLILDPESLNHLWDLGEDRDQVYGQIRLECEFS